MSKKAERFCCVCGGKAAETRVHHPNGWRYNYQKTCGSDECKSLSKANGKKRTTEWDVFREKGLSEWVKPIQNALSSFKSRTKWRHASSDPWAAKIEATMRSLNIRRRDHMHRPRKPVRALTYLTWEDAVDASLKRWISRDILRQKKLDPWFRKVDSVACNWRHKSTARSNERAALLSK